VRDGDRTAGGDLLFEDGNAASTASYGSWSSATVHGESEVRGANFPGNKEFVRRVAGYFVSATSS
jgi:hypothetical protein